MKKILEEVKKAQANMQSILGNGRNKKDIGSMVCPSMMVNNKQRRSNSSEKDQRGNQVLPQSKQHLDGCKVEQRNHEAMKEDFPPMAVKPKSRHASSSEKLVKPTLASSVTSKMNEGFVHRANDVKMSSSQPKNLKAMPGLVLKSIGQFRPATWMHKRDRMNGWNDITNDDNLRSRKESLPEEMPKSHDDSGSEGENPTHQTIKRRRKYIESNEDEDDNDNQSLEDGADDILKDCHERVTTPFVANCLKKQCYCCSKPIDKPVWSGLLNIGNKVYVPLSGHLSTKSCEKVNNLSKSLSRMVEVAKLPRSKVWPKRWEASRPIDVHIGLYFFPYKMRPDKSHDKLLKEVVENDLALRAIIDDAEMLLFPSNLLPKRYQAFQMKHYLWGVFRPREVAGKQVAALHQPDRTTEATAFAAHDTATRIATDAACMPPVDFGVATVSIPTEDATNAPNVPAANHGQMDSSSMGAPPGRIIAFVVKETPRLEQLIREMQREGALVIQGEMMSTGSWPGNIATVTQRGQPSKT
ncbi:hypothetical protein PAHAL_2G171900 [Panicum hallii]|nr:uncharacterized protein LOC112882341 isoform X2 [Panicum hallii]PAN11529.1 hypothetical protein PAHAL_2G171900 [Panicum hallii]